MFKQQRKRGVNVFKFRVLVSGAILMLALVAAVVSESATEINGLQPCPPLPCPPLPPPPVPAQPVKIDIKPGSFPNSINPKSKGTIPVAILSEPGFCAPAEVDRTSLTFGRTGNESSLAFCNKSPEDVNNDGLVDLICHFQTQMTGFESGDTEGILNGKTIKGIHFTGKDSVRIVPPK